MLLLMPRVGLCRLSSRSTKSPHSRSASAPSELEGSRSGADHLLRSRYVFHLLFDALPEEEWRDASSERVARIVSNLGRSATDNGSGYELEDQDNRAQQWYYRHAKRILTAFVGECPPGMECCHYDDNLRNNALSNLRWDTHGNNVKDAFRNGFQTELCSEQAGEANSQSKLTAEMVREARLLRAAGWTYDMLSAKFKVTHGAIWHAVNRKTWQHVA